MHRNTILVISYYFPHKVPHMDLELPSLDSILYIIQRNKAKTYFDSKFHKNRSESTAIHALDIWGSKPVAKLLRRSKNIKLGYWSKMFDKFYVWTVPLAPWGNYDARPAVRSGLQIRRRAGNRLRPFLKLEFALKNKQ